MHGDLETDSKQDPDLPRRLDPRWYPACSYERTIRVTETLTVSVDGNSFDGTVDQKFFDVNAEIVEDMARSMQRVYL